MNSVIYNIRNLKNDKRYFGVTTNFVRRQNYHKRALKNNQHHCIYLQRAWNKDGEQNFEFAIVEKIYHRKPLEVEQKWLDDPKFEKYNTSLVAGMPPLVSGKNHWNFGNHWPKEVKERMSHTRIKLGLSKGKNNGMYGVRRRGKNNPHYGGTQPAHVREKLSRLAKLRKGRLAANWKGVWVTPLGNFDTCEMASNKTKISIPTLIKLCKTHNNKPLSKASVCHLKIIGGVKVGATPKELGFGFLKVKNKKC